MSLLPLAERDDEFLDEAALRARYPYPILLFASYCFLLTAHYLLLTTYPREESLGLPPVGEPVAVQVKVDVEPEVVSGK